MVTDPQRKFFDDQDILSIDIDLLYKNFIVEIDNIRSRADSLNESSNDFDISGFHESRCHAFYRMIGLPVISEDGSIFYSPGYEPNKDEDSNANTQKVLDAFKKSKKLIALSNKRELNVEKNYKTFFSFKDVTSSALALASIFIRPLKLTATDNPDPDPLEDNTQLFTIDERKSIKTNFFSDQTLDSDLTIDKILHPLKPFIVDPRIERNIKPQRNNICVPFLKDKSQTKLFGGDSLKRPYLEKVISTRFNSLSKILISGNSELESIIESIKKNTSITDSDLVDLVQKTSSSSDLRTFDNYVRIIKGLINELHSNIVRALQIRNDINYQPLPNVKLGVEGGLELNEASDDIRNNSAYLQLENNIVMLNYQKVIDREFDTIAVGTEKVSIGDFAFSNIDDTVFGVSENIPKTFDEQIEKLNKTRNQYGEEANSSIRIIEIIMGDFSGLGLLDILILQAALWVISPSALIGMLDDSAYARFLARKDLRITDSTRMNILDSLKEFETKVSEIYKITDKYYNDLLTGDVNSKN